MKLFRSGAAAFILMVLLSLAVHAAVIGWVTKLPGLGLAGLVASDGISARIVREGRAGRAGAPARDTFADPPAVGESEGGVTETAGDSGGGSDAVSAGHRAGGTADNVTVPAAGAFSSPVETAAIENAGQPASAGAPLPSPEQTASRPTPAAKPGLLRVSRERLYFEISWLGVYVGKAVLEAEMVDGIQRITSRVQSAPVISAFYRVEDFAESTVRGSAPIRFRIKQREGKYRSDKETLFDEEGRVTYFDHLKGIRQEHEMRDKVLFDVISGFFYLRTRPMATGTAVLLDIFDSNKFLTTEVNILRNEQVTFLGRETEAVVVRPVLKSEGLFQSKGDIYIWLTNDERRIPVRVETKVGIGTVVAELKGMEREP